jgi:hypothetical protein
VAASEHCNFSALEAVLRPLGLAKLPMANLIRHGWHLQFVREGLLQTSQPMNE